MIKRIIKKFKIRKDGYFLIESMVAVSVVLVGLMSIVTLLSRSIGLNRVAGNRITANYLAAEGIEITKNLIDSNFLKISSVWNEGISDNAGVGYQIDYKSPSLQTAYNSANYLNFNSASGFYEYGIGDRTPFRRQVIIKNVSQNEIQVNSIVTWEDRGNASFSVNLEDHFFNWRVAPK